MNREFLRCAQNKKRGTSQKANCQLGSSYRPSSSFRSAQELLAGSLSFYLCMYICTLGKLQGSELLHIAQFPLRTRRQLH